MSFSSLCPLRSELCGDDNRVPEMLVCAFHSVSALFCFRREKRHVSSAARTGKITTGVRFCISNVVDIGSRSRIVERLKGITEGEQRIIQYDRFSSVAFHSTTIKLATRLVLEVSREGITVTQFFMFPFLSRSSFAVSAILIKTEIQIVNLKVKRYARLTI